MIESKAFQEMNSTHPIEPDAEPYSPSLPLAAAASSSSGSGGFLQKLKGKFKRQVSGIYISLLTKRDLPCERKCNSVSIM